MSFIQNLFTSRDNNANSATYVGQQDRLWYDPVTNTIRVSDGSTPGGSSITVASGNITFGDFQASGNTMTMINNNESMNFVATGSGSINLAGGGGLNIYRGNIGGNIAIEFLPTGFAVVQNPSVGTGQTGFLINGSTSSPTGGVAPQVPGTMLRVVGNDGLTNPLTVDTYGTGINPGVTGRAARGTAASPTATQTGDTFLRLAGVGYGNTNFVIDPASTGGKAPTDIRYVALENFTDITSGSQIQFSTSPVGESTRTLSATIDVTGITSTANMYVNGTAQSTSTETGALQVKGGAGIAKNLYVGGSIWGNNIYTTYLGTDGLGNILLLSAGASSSGLVQVQAGQFEVQTTTNPNPIFQINSDGSTQILAPAFSNSLGALNITGSSDGNSVSPNQNGVMLHITGQPGTPGRVYVDGEGNYPAYIGRLYNGNASIPTAVNDSQIMTRFAATPFNDGVANGWPSISATRIDMVATGNQTANNLGSRIEFWTTTANTVTISRNLTIDSNGLTFPDGSKQATAGIPLSYYGNANGVATLNSAGQVPTSQLPAGAVVYIGAWSAANNSPYLTNGVGTAGYEYSVSDSGTVNFGAGNIAFNPGDFVIYSSGNVWQKIPGTGSVVSSFNGRIGAVTLQANDVITAQGYTSYNGNTNPYGYVNSAGAASAAPVQSFNNRTGNITLLTSDVTGVLTANTITNTMLAGPIPNSKLANSNIVLGNTTINLGDTITSVSGLATVTATTGNIATINSTTINATTASVTGNITGGNINTSGIVSSTGNAIHGNILITGLASVAGNIIGGNLNLGSGNSTAGSYSASGNITAGNVNSTLHGNVIGSASNLITNTNSTAGTFLTGQVNIPSQVIAKNTPSVDVTVTVTGLTTSHKVIVTPAADLNSGVIVTAAYPSTANTLGIQLQNTNGGGITTTAFNLTYIAWV